jgi:versiconal hemiacetal acetate esterase
MFPKLYGPTIEDIRSQDMKNGEAMMAKYTFPGPDASIEKSWHTTQSGVKVKVYKPDTLRPNQPLVYYIHGGGFVLGSVDQDDRFCDIFSKNLGCVFASVEYRLAPEHKHPIPLNDCVDGAKWCIENAKSLGAKEGPIVITGKSAGGGLVFATALKLIDEGRGKDILGIAPCQPVTIHPNAVPDEYRSRYTSFDENGQ